MERGQKRKFSPRPTGGFSNPYLHPSDDRKRKFSSPPTGILSNPYLHPSDEKKRKFSSPPTGILSNPYLHPSDEKKRKFSSPYPETSTVPWTATRDLGSSSSAYSYAGQEAERLFPDSKTILNNALQQHLRVAEMKLNYDVTRVYIPDAKRQICRCSLDIQTPDPFTVIGEADSRKDAEKRASAAACVKLCVSQLIQGI